MNVLCVVTPFDVCTFIFFAIFQLIHTNQRKHNRYGIMYIRTYDFNASHQFIDPLRRKFTYLYCAQVMFISFNYFHLIIY